MSENNQTPVVVTEETKTNNQPTLKVKDTVISFKTIVMGTIVLLFVLFCLFNLSSAQVNFIFGTINAPLFVVMIISYIAGALVTWIMMAIKRKKD